MSCVRACGMLVPEPIQFEPGGQIGVTRCVDCERRRNTLSKTIEIHVQKTHQQTFHINKGPTAMDEPGLADAARAVLSSDRPLNGLSPKFDTGTLFACGRAKTASDCLLHGRHNAQGIPRSWTRRQFRPRSPPRVPEFRPFTRSTVRECGRLHDVRVLSAVQGSQAFPALVFAGSRLGS
jgi:hypothetical protein